MRSAITLASALALAVALGPGSVLAGGKPVQASGSGHFDYNGAWRTFSFTARTNAAGVTTGQVEGHNRSSDARFHGAITCLEVVGGVATMSGVLTSDDPDVPALQEGTPFWFRVWDNGEGANDAPDVITLTALFPVGPGAPCTAEVNVPAFPIEAGNVQVR